MEANGSCEKPNDSGLPLSCLRLIVPPLRLMSAAMWRVAKRRDVRSYDKLQDFVSMLTQAFPGLLTHRQRAQLLLGLRARLILELCKGSARGSVDSQTIQNHLEKLPVTSVNTEFRDAEVERTESTFIALVQSLLKDPAERAYFFQEVFPVEYGPSYDGALHILLWELLSKLEKVFAVPDLKQTAAWLNSDVCVADECMPTMPNDLSQIHQHHKNLGLLKMPYGPSSTIGGCIMSALSIPPSQKVCKVASVGLEAMHNYANLINPITYMESDQYSMVTVYEVEVELGATEVSEDLVETSEEICIQTEDLSSAAVSDHDASGGEDVEERIDGEKLEEGVDIATALETLTKTFAPKDETPQGQNAVELNDSNDKCVNDDEEAGAIENGSEHCAEQIEHRVEEERESLVVHLLPGNLDTNGGSESIEEFTPTPCATDQIFTSIKVLPHGSSEPSKKESKPDRQEGTDSGGSSSSVDPAQSPGRHKALTCDTCGRMFTRTADVRRHQLTHTGERPFHCSQCDRTFQHSWDLAKHETKHHGAAITFSCQLCGSSFANLRGLTVHHRGEHSGESQLPQICSICSQSFATTDDLLEHRRSHGDGQRYACHQCGDAFNTLLARSQHRQSHHIKRQFKCPHCDKTYTRRSDVKRHQATHTGERPHQCGQCGKRFSLRFMLAKHLSVHTGQRPFQCAHCPKRFTLVSILARHERMHTGEKPFLCSQCGKGFLSQGELSKHHRSHVDDKPYSCIQCDKCFKSKRSQREHVLSHTGARPYLCTHCGKGFTKLYALTRHNLIHTGERPFPCAHCGKTFLTLGEAQLHQRIHTGERPYACAMCELKFKSSSELGRHKRSHTSGKAWRLSCEQCGKSFSSHARLKKHLDGHVESQQEALSQGSLTVEHTELSPSTSLSNTEMRCM
ncbi:unnamed protein product [Merluccius merluccius]